ncbi:Substrate-specific component RibU of riboflavin ECF transporter [Streptococcus sp. DD11]|uniref:ECF transporter S component n=1 Tax=Streptococcus sp. DD11 TaxID=1777879 RepID=UPI00079850ED|nr:ECF transporter S component [Streptococcus sp. DD11]KXT84715.1 Substrate-specific component RibU of riboflavin ECF transporter [Streptococcus sp. DD11]
MTNTRKMATVAVLAALSFLLMFYQIPLVVEFLKLDFSIIPILLALVMLDLKSAFAVLLIRSVLKLALNGRGAETLIGLPMNILAVAVFLLAFALIWKRDKTLNRYLLASVLGTLALTAAMFLMNYFYAVPLYARFANFDINQMVGMSKYLFSMVIPFNLLEGAIWALVFWLIYTLLQPVLKRYEK